MSMRLPYITERDESLPHQVVFTILGSTIYISCNCRVEYHGPGYVKTYSPIGKSNNLDQARVLYNDPEYHRGKFVDEDMAKW